jgi:hypothetical protein
MTNFSLQKGWCYKGGKTPNFKIIKIKLNSVNSFTKSTKPSITSHLNTLTYNVGNPEYCLRQEQTCGGVKSVNGIPFFEMHLLLEIRWQKTRIPYSYHYNISRWWHWYYVSFLYMFVNTISNLIEILVPGELVNRVHVIV